MSRIGFVGCGSFASNFLRFWNKDALIVSLCDVEENSTRRLANKYNLQVQHYTDFEKMFNECSLDAVVITAANYAHCEIAVAAAKAGLHIFCDKAMARTVEECWEMVRASQKAGIKLMIGHKRRLRPPWARMIELTDESLLGQPLSITVAQYCDDRPYNFFDKWWADPELSGGFLHMHGVHVIDWFRAMCGDVKTVSALYGLQHDSRYKIRDIIHVMIQFQKGAITSLNGGLSYPLHKFRESQGPWGECEYGGFKMVPFMDHIDLYWQRLDQDEAVHERFDDLGFDHAFQREVSDFLHWIEKDETPCLTWIEGLRCVEVMEAAYKSAETDGIPIELPLHPELEIDNKYN